MDKRDVQIEWVFESNAWSDGDECITDWPWTFDGGRPHADQTYAARPFLAMADGIVPPHGMDAAHKCHNRACLRLDHLEWQLNKANASASSVGNLLLKASAEERTMILEILNR